VSAILPLTIEGLVSVLLLLTILYCVRLNSQLKRLKADETTMKATIAELLAATESAERAIAGLKTTVNEADQTLGESLRSAERFSADIAQQIDAGGELLSRLTQIAGVRSAAPAPAPVKPAAPDPKAIVAAAEAFAERARSRTRGLAA
jgi:hypothetical protein